MKKKNASTAWAVRLLIGPWLGFYFGWSKSHPNGYIAKIGNKNGPLLFATETEAEVAADAYAVITPSPFPTSVVQVNRRPTHCLTDVGFKPRPVEKDFALFCGQL